MVALLRELDQWNTIEEQSERRIFPRQTMQMRLQGRRNDHTLTALREPVISLMMQDISDGGFGALSQTPLAPNDSVTVFFPPRGPNRGWDATGRVVRCRANGRGYDIGVEFEVRALAA